MKIRLFVGWVVAVLVSTTLIRLLVVFIHVLVARLRLELFPPSTTLLGGIALATLWAFCAENKRIVPTIVNRDEVDEITAKAEKARVTVIKDMCSTNTLWVERDYLSQVGQVTRVILLAMPIGLFIAMFAGFLLSIFIVIAIDPEGCGSHGIKDPFLAYDTMSAADFARFCPDEAWTIWTIGASAIVGLLGGLATTIYWVVQREAKILRLRSASHGEVLDEYRAWKAARAAGG